MNSILMEYLSPTQERGESKVSTTILHDELTDWDGRKLKVKITYDHVNDVVVSLDFKVLGEHSIPAGWLKDMIMETIESHKGHSLTFDL